MVFSGSTSALRLNSLDLTPTEVRTGEDILVNAKWDIFDDIVKPVKAETKLVRVIYLFGVTLKIPLPCVNNIGSWYDNPLP